MHWRSVIFLSLSTLFITSPAFAEDDDFDLLGDEEDEPEKKRIEEDDSIDFGDDENALDSLETNEIEGDDLLGEEGPTATGTEGEDTAAIYRAKRAAVQDLDPDEELMAWEMYLEKYPQSLFMNQIETRMDELVAQLNAVRIGGGEERVDADEKEIYLSQGQLLDNINPRTRVQAGFEWGFPSYMNLFADYEHKIKRNISVHGGIRRRYTGFRVAVGSRWAFVKSTRHQMVMSVLGDIELNTNPVFPVFRPQLGIGKKFGKRLDVQLQGGVAIETRTKAGVRGIGGANITFLPSDTVGLFVETTLYMQNLNEDGRNYGYSYNAVHFGMKLFPKINGLKARQIEGSLGGSAPYASNYWAYHFGSVNAQAAYYFDM